MFQSDSIAENYRRFLSPTVFEPWAQRLVETVSPEPGDTVLDVASGTGAVARAAALLAGPTGRVIASDLSPGMLAEVSVAAGVNGAGVNSAGVNSAPIETLEAAATAIPLENESVDIVYCQHGLPFIRDQRTALTEMKRVLRPGGSLGIIAWVAGMRLEPFDSFGDVLREEGLDEPFPHAWDFDSVKMTRAQLQKLLVGFEDVTVETVSMRLDWPSVDDAVDGILGTPYGPVFSSLLPERHDHAMSVLRDWMTASPHPLVTAFVATARA